MHNLDFNLYAGQPYTPPLVVCYGAGVDSTAMLVGLHQRHIVPDAVAFADVGAERPATMAYMAIMNAWLDAVGFPQITVVRYQPKDFKHWPPYRSLEENLLTNVTFPSIAYGSHTCSAKWKIAPINAHMNEWSPARECWNRGAKVLKAIGFDDSPHEHKRAEKGCNTFAIQSDEATKFELWFPLQQWGWDRAQCEKQIAAAGLPVPPKSSCYFCTAMKPWEVDDLEPGQLARIVIIEARVAQRNLDFAQAKGWPRGVGVPMTEGLWRRRVKGFRGATPKPGSMTEYIREKSLLPAEQIDRLIELTPTEPITASTLGFDNWQSWIEDIVTRSSQ